MCFRACTTRGDEARPREVDVLAVADKLDPRRPASRCYVVFAIECKSSEKPWVALRSRDQGDRWFALDGLVLEMLTSEHLLGALEAEENPWVLGGVKAESFRVVQAFAKPGDADPVYAAFHQATAAARGFLHLDRPLHPAVAIPVVVTSGSLYSAGRPPSTVAWADDGSPTANIKATNPRPDNTSPVRMPTRATPKPAATRAGDCALSVHSRLGGTVTLAS
jgi:hypothetical protein